MKRSIRFTDPMQLRQFSIKGGRPLCPLNRSHSVHRHGHYKRYRHAQGHQKIQVLRWLCVVCGRTLSVLADVMLPYRAVGVALLEAWFDAAYHGRDPPGVTEVEKECVKRAQQHFDFRIPSLTSTLGQMIKPIEPTAQQLWSNLRELGKLVKILWVLAEKFKVSLLGDYRCLQPWSLRG